ncbi:hypothetical protein MHJ94_04930 [Chryseobacterium taklimakanense]|uniref:hypothetical protein n=1 Tax=Chryseobacterium taklimakanense TaxID=536441 RepID=UPI001EF48A58|nr:hypothetical protein [Chryseobacterium taklimakanense]MCG7280638.1 hypothetical protein [Chryseobacterium taklimakanense]
MKIKAAFIILFFLTGCQGKFESKLTDPDSVWLYAIKDAANNNKEKTMLLKFYSNGIADEADTDFVNFKWSYNPVTKTFSINSQDFDIVGENAQTIYLKHKKTGFKARLSKIK